MKDLNDMNTLNDQSNSSTSTVTGIIKGFDFLLSSRSTDDKLKSDATVAVTSDSKLETAPPTTQNTVFDDVCNAVFVEKRNVFISGAGGTVRSRSIHLFTLSSKSINSTIANCCKYMIVLLFLVHESGKKFYDQKNS